jgi:hypothetical protein
MGPETGDHKKRDQKWERARSIFRKNDLTGVDSRCEIDGESDSDAQVSDQKHPVFATAAELKDGALFGRSDQAIRSSVGALCGAGYLPIPACDDSAAETGRPGDYEKPDGGCKHSEGLGAEGSEEAVRVRKEKIVQAGEPDGRKQPWPELVRFGGVSEELCESDRSE